MSVPAHDQRDFDFAAKYGLPVRVVIAPEDRAILNQSTVPNPPSLIEGAFEDAGIMVNSGKFSGLKSDEGKEQISAHIEEKGLGKKVVNYKLPGLGDIEAEILGYAYPCCVLRFLWYCPCA